jgi:hypothetical protein
MRTKINIISWVVFLVLLNYMTLDRPAVRGNLDSYRVQNVHRVAYRKSYKMKKSIRNRG